MSWSQLFEETATSDYVAADVRDALASRRSRDRQGDTGESIAAESVDSEPEPPGDPMTRVVADADVLALDVLRAGASREAMDLVRSHDWIGLLASEALLQDGRAVLTALAGESVAASWLEVIGDRVVRYDHPVGDHPALATAVAGEARHVLSLDADLQTAGAGLAIRRDANVETSVRSPEAFVRLFDPATVYEAVYDEEYPGPDRVSR